MTCPVSVRAETDLLTSKQAHGVKLLLTVSMEDEKQQEERNWGRKYVRLKETKLTGEN